MKCSLWGCSLLDIKPKGWGEYNPYSLLSFCIVELKEAFFFYPLCFDLNRL